jgi:ABC-type nitrate/sulfonate/bicarbonate transport system substrate-binding protein
VAVNTLANTATPVIQAIVEEDGGDPDTIQFVELPFPDMISALDRGDVDAIWQPEPFGAVARGEGLTWLTKMFVGGPADALPLSCWITIDTVADDKGEALDAFDRSVVEARNAIDSDRTILEEIVPMYTELSPDLIAKVEPPVYRDDYTVEDVQRVADMMYKYDMLDEEFDASTLFLD